MGDSEPSNWDEQGDELMSTVAFLGLGRMGLPMAARLVEAGHTVTVWNRSADKAEAFAAAYGAQAASTVVQAARNAEFVVTMLADDAALKGVYESENGLLGQVDFGAIAIDMSTVAPETVTELAARVRKHGDEFIDAPVSGSVAAATAGTLTIMAGGDTGTVDRARPVLEAMGSPVIHMGPNGSGASMKLVVNAIVHSLNGAVSEALVLAERVGIGRESAYAVLLNSAVAAPFVQYRQAAFERPGDVPVAFRLALAAKDLRLALALAERTGADLPQTRTNLSMLEAAISAGFGDHDESGLAEYFRDPNPGTGGSDDQ